MSKRKGRKPLNLDASDDDSEPEESPPMVQPNQTEIRNRVMKVAKRRLTTQPPEGGVFGTLKATAYKPQPFGNLESTFAFLKNSNAATSSLTSGDTTSCATFSSLNGKLPSNSDKNTHLLKSTPTPLKSDLTFKRTCVDSPELNVRHSLSLPVKSSSPVSANGEKLTSAADTKELSQKDSDNPILEKVKILNTECLQWAQQHIDENPLADLRPVFKDYNQFFEAIHEEYRKSEASKPKESNASSETLVKLQNHIKTKNSVESKDDGRKADSPSTLSNIYSADSNAEMKNQISHSLDRLSYFSSLLESKSSPNKTKDSPAPTVTPVVASLDSSVKIQPNITKSASKLDVSQGSPFSFGKPSSETLKPSEAVDKPSPGSFLKIPALANNCFSNSSLFSKEPTESKSETLFGNIAPSANIFSVGSANAGAQQKTEAEEEEDEDQPPVVEAKPIVEEGAKYTARCKVFIKKEDNSYGDKGVGTLSLKALENSDKYQLVVRAVSTLGNILVNVLLSKDIPIQRTGKNNVLLVCLPTPDCEPPPKVVLLRVKTEEEADELHKVLKDAQA